MPLDMPVNLTAAPWTVCWLTEAASLAAKEDGLTVTSNCVNGLPLASRAATVERPGPTPKMKTLLALAGRTSTIFGSAANRLETRPLMRNTRPVPASSATLPGRSAVGCDGCGGFAEIWANAAGVARASVDTRMAVCRNWLMISKPYFIDGAGAAIEVDRCASSAAGLGVTQCRRNVAGPGDGRVRGRCRAARRRLIVGGRADDERQLAQSRRDGDPLGIVEAGLDRYRPIVGVRYRLAGLAALHELLIDSYDPQIGENVPAGDAGACSP